MFSKSFSFYGRPHQRQHNQPTQSSLLVLIFFSPDNPWGAICVQAWRGCLMSRATSRRLQWGENDPLVVNRFLLARFFFFLGLHLDVDIDLHHFKELWHDFFLEGGAETSNGLSKTFIKCGTILSLACTLCEESVTWASCVLWESLRHRRGRAPGT